MLCSGTASICRVLTWAFERDATGLLRGRRSRDRLAIARKNNYFVAVGFGAGKAWRSGKDIFKQPQWIVARDGAGLSQFMASAGLNITRRQPRCHLRHGPSGLR
jgi:hypothetical protein